MIIDTDKIREYIEHCDDGVDWKLIPLQKAMYRRKLELDRLAALKLVEGLAKKGLVEKADTKPTRIVVHLEGGLVVSVSSSIPMGGTEAVVIDYDVSDVDEEDIRHVPQSPNGTIVADACVGLRGPMDTTCPAITEYLDQLIREER